MSNWQDGGVVREHGVASGDYAVPGYSRRFTKDNADGTFDVVTVYYEPVQIGPRFNHLPGSPEYRMWDIAEVTETERCTDPSDPGGTEISADVEYDYPLVFAIRRLREATRQCRRFALSLSMDD